MPAYDISGFGSTPKLLIPGEPAYLFGSKPYNQADTRFNVTNTALTSNVVTLTIQILAGNIPVVGSLVSVRATTAGAGAVNATNAVAITAVTINAITGAGTITFPLTSANITSVADTGYGIIPVPESFETIVAQASVPVSLFQNESQSNMERTVNAICSFPTIPTACSVALQGAIRDINSEYYNIGTIGTVASSAVTASQGAFTLQNVKFIRAVVSGLTGSGTIVVKVF